MSIVKTVFGWIVMLCIIYFTAFRKLGDSHMIVLKENPSFSGTFFSIKTGRANNLLDMAVQI